MCGEINWQSVVYKSVAHLSDVGLASIDFLSRPILWNWTAISLTSDDFEGHLPIPVRWPMPGRCSRCSGGHRQITCRCFYDWKNRAGIGKLLTWPDGAPIANRRRWSADNPDNHQICHHRPKMSFFAQKSMGSASEPLCDKGITIKVNLRMCDHFPACELL